MPFTFSHPAIVLPLKYAWSKRFSLTALVIGSIVPDFEYFARFQNASYHSHKWPGVLWFDIPVGLLLCFIFHDVVKKPLIMNLPLSLHQRTMKYCSFNWKKYFLSHWLIVLYSLVLGIISHLFWDKVTHETYRVFNHVPVLKDSLDPDFHPNLVYRIIQMSYSLAGLAFIAFSIWKLPRDTSFDYYRKNRLYWTLFGFLAASIMGMTILSTGLEFVDWIIATISSLLIALTISSFLLLKDKWILVKGWK